MELSGIVRNEILMKGLSFTEEFGAFQLTMTSGQRCWRTLINVTETEIVCCSQFPWTAGAGALKTLNQLNCGLAVGCFLMKDGRVLFRCGAVVTDQLCAGEVLFSLLRLNGNTVCSYWERVKCCGGSDEH